MTRRLSLLLTLVLWTGTSFAPPEKPPAWCLLPLNKVGRWDVAPREWNSWKRTRKEGRDGASVTGFPFGKPEKMAEFSSEELISGVVALQRGEMFKSQVGNIELEALQQFMTAIRSRPPAERREALTAHLRAPKTWGNTLTLVHGRSIEEIIDYAAMEKVRKKHGYEFEHTWTDGVYETRPEEVLRLAREAGVKDGDSIVDIGSGFGTPGIVLGAQFPKSSVTGFEIVPTKLKHAKATAKTWGLGNVEFVEQDLSAPNFKLPDADVYYMYSPVNTAVAKKLLRDLKAKANVRKFKLIVNYDFSVGSGIELGEQKWLKEMSGRGYGNGSGYVNGNGIFETVPP